MVVAERRAIERVHDAVLSMAERGAGRISPLQVSTAVALTRGRGLELDYLAGEFGEARGAPVARSSLHDEILPLDVTEPAQLREEHPDRSRLAQAPTAQGTSIRYGFPTTRTFWEGEV